MRDFIITTDSNADLPADFIKEHQLTIIPQYYAFGDVVYGDERNLTPEEFYTMMEKGDLPTSMANNPAVIRDKFEKILQEDKDILHIAFSSTLSGSYNNVVMIAKELMEEYKDSTISVVDTLNVSLGEAFFVMEAIDRKKSNQTMDQIKLWLENNRQNSHVEFTVDDVNHLYRGGRISKTTSIVLGIVNIKPLLYLTPEGKLASKGTIRGRKRSLSALVKNMGDHITSETRCKRVGIVHAKAIEDAQFVASLVAETYPDAEVIINDISPSIGTHAGPGAIGICYLVLPEESM
ncbi:DegV family protein with EDD domain [Aequitasia blattaphilus]|uniref:DegV family protein n=1 Tax=Aequitasia blattaphilus TaxID=2949332 RepID=A0ABT1E9E1_9FIRM|nr:DegV family protein [Aequitasia blattaphilus]MCP1101612.1 DegV family protein [Aequitasia blattaphilus]MCR8614252.1 DegV family protein [Aequitasia blattaphilus]